MRETVAGSIRRVKRWNWTIPWQALERETISLESQLGCGMHLVTKALFGFALLLSPSGTGTPTLASQQINAP